MPKCPPLLTMLCLALLFSCGSTEETEDKTSLVVVKKTAEIQKIKARFEMYGFGTGGAWMLFYDDKGELYEFHDKDKPKELDFILELKPNEPDPRYENVWFDLEYQKQIIQGYDGSTASYFDKEVLVIISINRL